MMYDVIFFEDHVYEIVACVFQYLEMLRRQEPPDWIFKECQVLSSNTSY